MGTRLTHFHIQEYGIVLSNSNITSSYHLRNYRGCQRILVKSMRGVEGGTIPVVVVRRLKGQESQTQQSWNSPGPFDGPIFRCHPFQLRVLPQASSISRQSLIAMPKPLTSESILLPPKLDINAGAKSHFFQPPWTPSASSSLPFSAALDSVTDVSKSRGYRRPRHDPPTSTPSPALIRPCDTPPVSGLSIAQSPPPFVTTKYELAGGLDAPSAATFSSMDLQEGDYRSSPSLHLRAGRGFRGFENGSDGYSSYHTPKSVRDLHGTSSIASSPRIRNGLGRAVYGFFGVAGRVLDFCKATAFQGFYAGGGQGYSMDSVARSLNYGQRNCQSAEHGGGLRSFDREDTLVPGQFPEDDYIPDYISYSNQSLRASKKIQREKGVGELSASWVMVDGSSSRENSPSRLSHRRLSSTPASARRYPSKLGRRPILPPSQHSQKPYTGSPGSCFSHSASYASPRSPTASARLINPVSLDGGRHVKQSKKRKLEDDAQFKRFNLQLRAMIKEGKEALGTQFKVEEAPIDEGYGEEESIHQPDKG